MSIVETLLPKVKANLILEHSADDELLRGLIRAAVSYAESYQHITAGGYEVEAMPATTEQAVIMLSSHFYESRDGSTADFFADSVQAGQAGLEYRQSVVTPRSELEGVTMSFGKMNTRVDIIQIAPVKDAEGFVVSGDTILATVRAYREEKHGNESWANRAAFSNASALFPISQASIARYHDRYDACL